MGLPPQCPPSPSCSADTEWEVIPFTTISPSASPPKPSRTLRQTSKQDTFEIAVLPGSSASCSISQPTFAMPGWKDEYLSSLMQAERDNPVNFDLVEACSRLNGRIAALEAEKNLWQSSLKPSNDPSTTSSTTTAAPTTTTTETPSASDPLLARVRKDLADTLEQKGTLETRLRQTTAERDRLLGTSKSQSRTIATLTSERDALRTKVQDQAEELKGKKRMLEQVQDEVLALDMQLNVAEQQKAKIAAENKNLIERWMRRAKLEAEEMNAANERRMDGPP